MFTGGGLFDVGALAAGYEPIWGIEKDDKIAAVARLNGFPVTTADVTHILDFTKFPRPDHLHASPPCPQFSNANQNKGETQLDIDMARKVCAALIQLKPDTFTLENVVGYRGSISFGEITKCLSDLGYWWDATNLNAADFGVPQTRNRLWMRASRGLLMPYSPPRKWVGWYAAIEDILHELPDSQFAPWQLARLPEEYKDFMIGQGTYSSPIDRDQPADTITANGNQQSMRAFIASGGNINANSYEPRKDDEPHPTVTASMDRTPSRAFIMDGQTNDHGNSITTRAEGEHRFTLSASGEKRPLRAYVGRVVKMNVHALGRFQSVPDTYKGLTVKINGNGCPPLQVQQIMEMMQ